MINDQLHRSFIDLVSFDQKIHAVEEELRSLKNSLSSLEVQSNSLHKSLDEMKQQVHDVKKRVDEQELMMKVLDQQETEKKSRLENVSNSKEYSAIKSEIQRINEQQRNTETTLIEAWDELDAAQKKFVQHEMSTQAKLAEFAQMKIDFERKIEASLMTLESLNLQRLTFLQMVPEELLDNYEHMRGLVPNPVVQVVHGSCSACFYAVPGQDLAALKRGKLLPCKSCYRILFFEELPE